MSKLAKLIDATITGDKKLVSQSFNNVSAMMGARSTHDSFGVSHAIKIGVVFEKIIYVTEHEQSANAAAIMDATRTVKRAMVEEIFGEFRPLLLEASSATYDADMIRLRSILAEIEHTMFRDGI